MTPYLTAAELSTILKLPTSEDLTTLQRCLEAARSWIDSYCGRVFVLDANDVTRYYYSNSQSEVEVVDLVTVTSIAIDTNGDRTYATTLSASDYELLPLNEPRYDTIRIWPTSSKSFSRNRRVRVVGKAGYVDGSSTPADVIEASRIIATRLFYRKDSPFGVLGADGIGDVARVPKMDPDVETLLCTYRRTSRAVSWVMV